MKNILYSFFAFFVLCPMSSMAAKLDCPTSLAAGQWEMIFEIFPKSGQQIPRTSWCTVTFRENNTLGSGTCSGYDRGGLRGINYFVVYDKKFGCKLTADARFYDNSRIKVKGVINYPDYITGGGEAFEKNDFSRTIGKGVYAMRKIN